MPISVIFRANTALPAVPYFRQLEKLALADRHSLGCRFGEPFTAMKLLKLYDVGAIIETYADYAILFERDMAEELRGLCLSGAVLKASVDTHVILLHPDHSPSRRNLTLCHEFGHLACGHKPFLVPHMGSLMETRYSDADEQEAYHYALAVLLPYAPLLQLLRQGATLAGIAYHYGVSVEAVRWRINAVGLGNVTRTV